MHYLSQIIKIFIIFTFGHLYTVNSYAKDQIIFKLDNKIFTTIDLDNRKKYLELLNNKKLMDNEIILNDLINISLYDTFFQKSKKNINKKKIDNLYNEIFKKYELNKNKKYFSKIFKELTKEIVINNIRYDLQKKSFIEEKLNKKREIIFKKNNNKIKLYDINIEFFLIKKEYIKDIQSIIGDLNYDEISKKLKSIEENNIEIIYKTKKIKKIDNLNTNLKKSILSNKKNFYFENNSNVFIGKIIKRLKNVNKIDLSLYQIVTKKEIPQESLKCNNIKNIESNLNYKTINKEIDYNKINEDLKLKLNIINDFAVYENENTLIYIILCNIKYDKNIYEQININDNIKNLAKEIDDEFIFINKKKNNLKIIDE